MPTPSMKVEKCKKWYHTNKKHENCWMDVLVFRIYWNTWIKLLLNNFDIWQLMNEKHCLKLTTIQAFCILFAFKYKYKTSIDSDWYILKVEKCKKWHHTNSKHDNCWMDVVVLRIYWNTWIKLLLNNFDIWQSMNENIA